MLNIGDPSRKNDQHFQNKSPFSIYLRPQNSFSKLRVLSDLLYKYFIFERALYRLQTQAICKLI